MQILPLRSILFIGDFTDLFAKHLGEVFHMGGLAGIPFTGKTGFAAMSNHAPDGMNSFLIYRLTVFYSLILLLSHNII
jgi:hypothetical protein